MVQETLTGKNLFLVEDDPLLQRLLTDKLLELKGKGLKVHAISTGEDALAIAKQTKPDLVLLDIVLPGMSGFEFLEQFRKEPASAKTPVVVLSNLNADTDKERAKSLGVIAYLVKANFSLKEISGEVEKLLLGGDTMSASAEAPDIKKTSEGTIIYL